MAYTFTESCGGASFVLFLSFFFLSIVTFFLAKSARSNIFSYFVSEFGYTGERLIPGLRQKDWILRALFLAEFGSHGCFSKTMEKTYISGDSKCDRPCCLYQRRSFATCEWSVLRIFDVICFFMWNKTT